MPIRFEVGFDLNLQLDPIRMDEKGALTMVEIPQNLTLIPSVTPIKLQKNFITNVESRELIL